MQQSIKHVPNIGRNIYIVTMPQYSYFRLKDAKAEISCFKCQAHPLKCQYQVTCKTCNGSKKFESMCNRCWGSGLGNPRIETCTKCKGSGTKNYIHSIHCCFCNHGKAKRGCSKCYGNGYIMSINNGTLKQNQCFTCKGNGFTMTVCLVCNGQYTKQKIFKINCDKCNGHGSYQIGYYNCNVCNGNKYTQIVCDDCNGNGTITIKCNSCKGYGVIPFP